MKLICLYPPIRTNSTGYLAYMQLVNVFSLDLLAYIDGGTGSMLLQAALAGVLTAAFFLKSQWVVLKSKVMRRKTPNGS